VLTWVEAAVSGERDLRRRSARLGTVQTARLGVICGSVSYVTEEPVQGSSEVVVQRERHAIDLL
jgi:hypothetical protein